MKLTPPKLSRLATRPATTLSRMPAKESSVHSGSRVGHLGRQRAAEARQLGAQAVLRADVAGAAAGAEDHRGALAVEGLLVIAGVLDRLPRHLERHQLHRVDRGDRLRRHAVAHRVEHHVVEEAAPLRIDLVLGGAVGVEVEPPVPAVRRDLGDRVDLVEDVLPVLARRVRLGQDAGDADDRDVGRRVGRQRPASRPRRAGCCSSAAAPSLTSRCSASIRVTRERRVATWPSMYMPSARCSRGGKRLRARRSGRAGCAPSRRCAAARGSGRRGSPGSRRPACRSRDARPGSGRNPARTACRRSGWRGPAPTRG